VASQKGRKPRGKSVRRRGGRAEHAAKMRSYLPHYISRLMNVLNMRLLDLIRPYGVTIRQFRILQMLDARHVATIGEIAADTVIEQSVVSRIIDQLERDGLAQRRRRPRQRSLVDVRLTPRGTSLYRSMVPHALAIVEDAVSELSAQDRAVLQVLLSRMFETVTRPFEPWKRMAEEPPERR
jgi:DNA-binding MarR family transcriptional regulator